MTKVFWTAFGDLSYLEKSGNEITVGQSAAKITLLAIADSANDYGENSWNSYETLAQKTSLARRSVLRTVRALIANKYLVPMGTSRYGTNNFSINLARLGDQPIARKGIGRPKTTSIETSDSPPNIGDSPPNIGDAVPPDPSLSIPIHPIESQQKLQTQPSLPAKESPTMITVEERKKRTEEALFASLSNASKGYTHEYPEEIRPVIAHLESRWHLPAPPRPRSGKGKQYAYWLESSRALLDACAEFGVGALDLLRDDFEAYMADHNGVAPHTVSTPNSLVNSMLSKAAQLRGGNTAPMWGSKKPQARQTMLDV
jgi:hypothetical protein